MKVPEEETLNNYILCKRNTPMSWVGKKHFLVRKTMIITTGFQCSSNWQQADLLRDKWVLNDSPGPCSFIIQEWYHSELQPGANRSWLALCRLIISKTVFVEFSQDSPKFNDKSISVQDLKTMQVNILFSQRQQIHSIRTLLEIQIPTAY